MSRTMYIPPMMSALVSGVGRFAIIPLLPRYVEHIGGDAKWVGLFMSAQSLGAMVGTIWLGYFSDVVGVKCAMTFALLVNPSLSHIKKATT